MLPRTLFLKLFLWFSAVMVTVIVGTFIIGELQRHDREGPPPRQSLEQLLSTYAKEAARAYERGGQPALIAYLEAVERESNIRAFLFDSQLRELTGRRMPANAPTVARQVFETERPQFAEDSAPPLFARPATSDSGARYVLVAEPPHRSESLFHPLMHILAIILTGGLFCYWLARYLTSPVGKLRAATQELAKGNLSVRVVPTMGNRRDELASLAADFDLMAEKIESLINGQRRLLGDISHELRSPLARLNVALELARQRAGDDAAGALERIQHEAEILNEMIGQLLTLTRLESGAEGLKKTRFDLVELVTAITDDAQFEAASRNRSVRLKTSGQCITVGNELLLRRAIENVVRNAVQYTAAGSEVEVEVTCEDEHDEESPGEVSSSKHRMQSAKRGSSPSESDSEAPTAVITVRDHGSGVPESALIEIFRPFYRVDDARDREAGGVGLGLAIADRAVRLHGGSVKAANEPTGGLVVTIVLPFA